MREVFNEILKILFELFLLGLPFSMITAVLYFGTTALYRLICG